MNNSNEEFKNNWNSWSNEYYAKLYENTDALSRIINTPTKSFPTKVWENINRFYPCLDRIKVCVPSSGDNVAAFAFHVLGAKVTSCDISSEQIQNAKKIADEQGWSIDFQVCDSMNMNGIKENDYDLVFTSNGVHTWISNLSMMHSNFNRILKKNGRYILFETHPFIRPFDDKTNELRVKKPYNDTANNDWRVQDFINSLTQSGFTINRMDELFAEKDIVGAEWWKTTEWDEKGDWHINPYAALPQWLSICSMK